MKFVLNKYIQMVDLVWMTMKLIYSKRNFCGKAFKVNITDIKLKCSVQKQINFNFSEWMNGLILLLVQFITTLSETCDLILESIFLNICQLQDTN